MCALNDGAMDAQKELIMSKKKIKKFTINYKKWGQSEMRSPDGKMCCLGFLGKACGYKASELTGYGMPTGVVDNNDSGNCFPPEILLINDCGLSYDTELAEDLARINDGMSINEKYRYISSVKMALIERLFKDQAKIKVSWTNVPAGVLKEYKKFKSTPTEKLYNRMFLST